MKSSKNFYQWDINQKFTECDGRFVDFIINEKDIYRVDIVNGECIIPDEFLQKSGYHTVYECMSDYTIQNHMFPVHPREKPPGYVYTPTEKLTFEGLVQKVNDTVADIIHRADTGEFDGYTPVKGKDYFTESEKNEMVQSVSSGAVGEFREVVDSATADFDENSSVKTNDYNSNAEKKLSTYNSNATEKFKAYNDNHTEKMTAYDTNATEKLTTYNRNAEQKLEAYNSNHTEKLTEYNQNAETKKAEFDASVGEQIAEKANIDGYYEEMTVGDAEQLISTQFVENNEPYLFRPTGGSSDVGNRAYLDTIVGGTVAWNQLANDFELYGRKGQVTRSDNKYTYTFTKLGTSQFDNSIRSTNKFKSVSGHRYLEFFDVFCTKAFTVSIGEMTDSWSYRYVIANVKEQKSVIVTGNGTTPYLHIGAAMNNANTFAVGDTFEISNIQLFDLTRMFGSTIADYIYSLEQSQAGAGVAWFKKLFPNDYYPYNAGELLSVEGLQSHDTVGFNQWDEEWEVGSYGSDGLPTASDDKIRTKNRISVKPSTAYYFKNGGSGNLIIFWYDDNDTVISYESVDNSVKTSPANAKYLRFRTNNYGTTYNHDICVNLNSPSRNGEYEPYEKHSYPLDSSLTLRGIPKLDASNNLYYDGDEYASDGKVTRKYGIIDLGTIDWVQGGTNNKTSWVPVSWKTNVKPVQSVGYKAKILCNKYRTDIAANVEKQVNDKTIAVNKSSWVYIYDSAYISVTPQEFKTAMSGVYLVYELATPTTETAEPFQNIQVVDDFGTEEFVSTGIVPVGHNTRYPANLRDKLQHLPSLASADGTYLIQQSGKQMSLIHMPAVFPEIPTEDGTYTLKTAVTGGVATLQWVVE